MHSTALAIPQPHPLPVVGNLLQLDPATPVQSFMKLAAQLGPIFRFTLPQQTMLVVTSHELVAELCDERRFEKHLHGPLRQLRELVGDGLFTAETQAPVWGQAHRLLMPAFGPQAMRTYFQPMLDLAEQLVEKWARLGPNVDLDVPDNMTRLTLDTIALCGFGYRFNSFYQREMHPFVDAMVRSLAESGARGRRLPLQTKLMLMTRQQYDRDLSFMNEVVDEIIRERKSQPLTGEQKDLLGLMLQGADPLTGERLDDVNIRHQIITFLIAGHETTSGLLSFAIYNLLKHPHTLQRATEEADRVLGNERPTFEKLRSLTYLDQVLRETLRLWPTAPAFAVHALEDTLLGGRYPLSKGQIALVLTPMLHRDPTVWGPDPERFDPERFSPEARIPTHAWKPFGNGQRACIGRQFAMQEAVLVLAMLLRRLELSDHAGYQLEVKETLTLKPEGFTIRVRERKQEVRAPPAPAKGGSVGQARPEPRAVARHGTPLRILFGSNAGSSEAFARRIAHDALAQGYSPSVEPMDAAAGRLPREGAVVLVTASYNGRPPDNAKAFCAWLETLEPEALKGVRYTVFGCGHRDWAATYQAVPTQVDQRLAAAGATRLLPRGGADGRGDFFGDFDGWYEAVWPTLGEAFQVRAETVEAGPRYEVQRLSGQPDPLHGAHQAQQLEVLSCRELVDLGSPFGRSKRHLELRLPEGTSYRAGDHLAVLPENPPSLVERAARRFQLPLTESVRIRPTREEPCSLPIDRPITVGELLGRYVELSQPATRREVQLLASHTACPPERRQLLGLAEDARYKSEVLGKRRSVLDLLEEFAACELPFALLLELLPPMKPRRYSISSSPKAGPSRCTLTLSVVAGEAWSGRGRFEGTASTFLARARPGQLLAATVRPPHAPFLLPEDPSTPVIFVAAGSGMAPFRGFVEERASLKEAGLELGPALYFFGCDHPDVDYLYRDELEAWQQRGVVEMFPAFFRNEREGVTFVQHRVWRERERVTGLLAAGARIYVCGDGQRMAPAVRETFVRLHCEGTGCTPEAGEAWMRTMESEQRYLADVFAG